MLRVIVLATLFFVVPRAGSGQPVSILHIKVALAAPVPNHALLISDNPATSTPRRVVTALDGTVDVRLRPGNYTVESDEPMAFMGKAYQWTQTVNIVAGRDTVLALTADNAEVGPVTSGTTPAPLESRLSSLLTKWQDSIVALWTPTTHASGFVIDASGLIATNQRGIGTTTSVEVQLAPAVKVAARVLAADPARDVAILWIDPTLAASVQPVPLGCAQAAKPAVVVAQEIFTIGAPLRQQKGPAFGTVSRVEAHSIAADISLPAGSAGGPVFTSGGGVIGLTSVSDVRDDERSNRSRGSSRVVRIEDVCDVLASAEKKMKKEMNDAAAPNGTHLPVEPVRPFPEDALKDAATRRAGSLSPYQMSSSDFDIAFITPVQIYGAQGKAIASPLMAFRNWSEYIADFPPVLLVRVTPKLVEGFWTTVARGAAYTQGAALPPIKHVKSGFSRMRAFCGDAEVTPIHPFTLEQRVSESDAIYEGLYVLDPEALGPQCATVKLVLFSEKAPEKGDTRVVDPKVLQQIWQDFAPYRALQ